MLYLLIISLFCALLCAWMAYLKKKPAGHWFLFGLAFGPFALPFILLARASA